MKVKEILILLGFLLGICMMGYAYGQIAETNQTRREGDAAYKELSGKVKKQAADNTPFPHVSKADEQNQNVNTGRQEEAAGEEAPTNRKVSVPDIGISFELLKTVSADAVAWLYCPDTLIDYPVMKADDYAYYLSHLPDGTPNANGSLFVDFNNTPDFSDSLTIIYGHNMKSKMMFGSLAQYKSQEYYDEHPCMYLYTQEANYRIELLYGCVIGAGQWRERSFMYKENAGALLAYAAHNTTFDSRAAYLKGDRIVAMSTCSYEFEDARYVVVGILRGED